MPRKKQYQWQGGNLVEQEDGPSRSAKKRQCHALQALGKELTLLSSAELKTIDLPQDLLEALQLYARISNKEGKRRQLQYIGRLMREMDADSVQAALDARRDAAATETTRFHLVEQWRNRLLLAAEHELEGLLQQLVQFPSTTDAPDIDTWQRLTQEARQELAQQEQAGQSGKKVPPHARRALFRALASALSASSTSQQD